MVKFFFATCRQQPIRTKFGL